MAGLNPRNETKSIQEPWIHANHNTAAITNRLAYITTKSRDNLLNAFPSKEGLSFSIESPPTLILLVF